MSWFCKHDYEELERHDLERVYYYTGARTPVIMILYKCKKCGKFKKVYLP